MLAPFLVVAVAAPQLSLGQAVDQALSGHRRLDATQARIEQRRGDLDAQSRAFDSTTSATLGVAKPSGAAGALELAKRLRYGTSLSVGYDYGLAGAEVGGISASLAQPLRRGLGRHAVEAAERAARADLASAESDHSEARLAQVRDVAAAYWGLVVSHGAASKLLDAQVRADKLLAETRVLVRAHERPATELHLLEASSADQARAVLAAERAELDAAYALASALGGGQPPEATTPLPSTPPAPPPDDEDGAWVERALAERPTLLVLRARVDAATATHVAAADAATAQIDLVGEARSERWPTEGVAHTTEEFFFGLASDLPFSNPAGDAAERSARAALREARALLQAAELEVAVQVRRRLAAVREGRKVLERAEAARAAYVDAVRAERAKLKAGFSTVFQVTIIEDRLTSAELVRLDAWGRYMADLARLWFVTGALAGAKDPGAALLRAPVLRAGGGAGGG